MSPSRHRRKGRRKGRRNERGPLQLLEEAFHLLRTVSPAHLWVCFSGTVPFAVACLWFTADMSRSSHATRDSALVALVLAAAWLWMTARQARFAAGLWESIAPGALPERSRSERFRRCAALWLIQAFHLPALVLGAFFVLPLAWVIAIWQSATALAFTTDDGGKPLRHLLASSFRHGCRDWVQNHGLLLVLLVAAFFLWANILGTCVILPTLAKSLFGIESPFTINPVAAFLNTTFLAGTFLTVHVALSPAVRAVYVLRCFYAESSTTGSDLLSRLAACRETREKREARNPLPARSRTPGRGADADQSARRPRSLAKGLSGTARTLAAGILASAVFSSVFAPASPVMAETSSSAEHPPAAHSRLDEAIAETMEQKKYQWSLSRREPENPEAERGQSWIETQLRNLADSIESSIRAVLDFIERAFEKWMKRWERDTPRVDPDLGWFKNLGWLKDWSWFKVALIVLVAVPLLWWLYRVVRREMRSGRPREADDMGPAGPVDLESEDIVASQLPEDEWMRLAREQIAKGETRLAVRALFLASLAHLGERELLRIARFKSNRDYRRELEFRARHLQGIRDAFDENTGLFERVWYGLHRIGDETLERFLANCERIAGKEAGRSAGTGTANIS